MNERQDNGEENQENREDESRPEEERKEEEFPEGPSLERDVASAEKPQRPAEDEEVTSSEEPKEYIYRPIGGPGPSEKPQERPKPPSRPQQPPQGQAPGQPPRQGRPPQGGPPPSAGSPPRSSQRPAPPPGYGQQPPGYGGPGGRPPQGPQGYGGQQPQPPQFQPPKRPTRIIPIAIGVIILLVVLGVGLVGLVGGISGGTGPRAGTGITFPFGEKVAVLDINGVIGEGPGYTANTNELVKQVKSWKENQSVRALVLRINSPGGAVSATQDLVSIIEEFKKTDRPVVASMGDVAASGGIYTAMGAEEIFANPGSLTGSIGVILNFYDYQELQDMVGVKSRVVKSGEFKDIGSGSRSMTEEEKELLDKMVEDVYEQFFDAVLESRKDKIKNIIASERQISANEVTNEMVEAHIAEYADGRIFSGRQAYQYGFVDTLGTIEDAIDRAASLANMKTEPSVVRAPTRPRGLFGAVGAKVESLGKITNPPLLEYRFAGF